MPVFKENEQQLGMTESTFAYLGVILAYRVGRCYLLSMVILSEPYDLEGVYKHHGYHDKN